MVSYTRRWLVFPRVEWNRPGYTCRKYQYAWPIIYLIVAIQYLFAVLSKHVKRPVGWIATGHGLTQTTTPYPGLPLTSLRSMSISGPSGANAFYGVYAASEQPTPTQIPTTRSMSVPTIPPFFPAWPTMTSPASSSSSAIRPPGNATAKSESNGPAWWDWLQLRKRGLVICGITAFGDFNLYTIMQVPS